MKRSAACILTCLGLTLAMLFWQPAAMAEGGAPDASPIPQDAVAVFLSPTGSGQPRIIYAIYGVTKAEETLTVMVRQISADPQLTIYEESAANGAEEQIRQMNEFSDEIPIVGSYCEAYIIKDPDSENPLDKWFHPQQSSTALSGRYMDEQFVFDLSAPTAADGVFTLGVSYHCIAVPGTLIGHPVCHMSLDLSPYLN